MTEKRFQVIWECLDDSTEFQDNLTKTIFTVQDVCELLNELDSENKELKEGVEELNEICKYYEMRIKELSEQADAVREELRLCEEENNALQERNDRQAETIKELYAMIENKDWKALTTYMEELDRCEEQLRKEWRFYSD